MDLWRACFGVLTEERWSQLLAWATEDDCFACLYLLLLDADTPDFKLPEEAVEHLGRHRESCPGCWENVLITSQNTDEPLKRKAYLNLYHFSQWGLMQKMGGEFELAESPEGMRFKMTYPPDFEGPWVGGELIYYNDRSRASESILDVRSQEFFDDEKPVLDYLDRTLVQEVQGFSRPGGESIQWWPILEEGQCTLSVRWQGRVKLILQDWRLQPKYHNSVRKHRTLLQEPEDGPDADTPGAEADAIRAIALKYDGRSRFRGFLKTTLHQREVDLFRHSQLDAENRNPSEIDDQQHSSEFQASPEANLLQREVQDRLARSLDEVDHRILELKREDWTDEDIGMRLGLRRETVNRRYNRAWKLATSLLK